MPAGRFPQHLRRFVNSNLSPPERAFIGVAQLCRKSNVVLENRSGAKKLRSMAQKPVPDLIRDGYVSSVFIPLSVMRADMPSGCASHAEASYNNSILVDGILLLRMRDGLQYIDFASELEGVAVTAIRVQNEGISGDKASWRALPFAEKVDLTQRLASAVQEKVEAVLSRLARAT